MTTCPVCRLSLPVVHPDPASHDSSGARLRELRASVGMTQEQFRRLLGVSEKTMRRYEAGDGHDYPVQYLAEAQVRRLMCEELERRVRADGGDARAVLYAQSLHLSGRGGLLDSAARAVAWRRRVGP